MEKTEEYKKKAKILRNLNIAAFALHGVSFIVLLILAIIYAPNSFQVELTTDFKVLKSLGKYQIIWLELPFPFITALFHATIALNDGVRDEYTRRAIFQAFNPLRWLEYAITASFMTWIILQLSGVTNILTLIFVGIIGNVALQAQGYMMEKMNPPRNKQRINWIPTIVGWLIFVGQWSIIVTYFFASDLENAPGFVYGAVFGLVFQFALFGIVQLCHYLGWPRFLRTGYATEIAFVVLSFISKFFLDWTLSIGILTRMDPGN